MELTGERRIAAPRQRIWQALNDTDLLKASIPGCDVVERVSAHEMGFVCSVRIGSFAARFSGRVTLAEADPPHACTLHGEGQGGIGDSANGSARIQLSEEGRFTRIAYTLRAELGGQIAQLDPAVVRMTAESMADEFLDRLDAELAGIEGVGAEGAAGMLGAATRRTAPATANVLSLIPGEPWGYPLPFWIGGTIFFAIFWLIVTAYF